MKELKNIILWYLNVLDIIKITIKKKNFENIETKINKDEVYTYTDATVDFFNKIKFVRSTYKILRNIVIIYITTKIISIITITQVFFFIIFYFIRLLGIEIKGNKENNKKWYVIFIYNTNMSVFLIHKNRGMFKKRAIIKKIIKKIFINALFLITWGYPKIVIKKSVIASKILINISNNSNKTKVNKAIDIIFKETFLKDKINIDTAVKRFE